MLPPVFGPKSLLVTDWFEATVLRLKWSVAERRAQDTASRTVTPQECDFGVPVASRRDWNVA